MRALVTGASGYVGSRLVAALLGAGHEVVATSRDRTRLARFDFAGRARAVSMDAGDAAAAARALAGVDVAYYLVHSIGDGDFRSTDRRAAIAFATAARAAGVARVVYLGGLVPADEELSEHLASRAEVGALLAEHGPDTVELRAAVVLGAGSTSYEVVRYLADWLPVVPLPPWMHTQVQPVATDDVLHHLLAAAQEATPPGVHDLGGPERLPYAELIRRYSRVAGQRRLMVPTPPVPRALAAWVVARLTPLPQDLVADLVLSLANTMTARPAHLLTGGPGTGVDEALRRARVGSHTRRSALPGVCALGDPLGLARTDADWAHRRR